MITFIIPCSNVLAYGPRIISSYLKAHGHNVQLIFIIGKHNEFAPGLSAEVFGRIVDMASSSRFIGLSVMTNYFLYARDITRALKERTDVPVIWGGIHPTVVPEECLEVADIVCIGEGEEPMLELADSLKDGKINYEIKNLWFKAGGKIIKNDIRPLVQDLDKFPVPDYELSSHFILNEGGQFIQMTEKSLKDNLIQMYGRNRYSFFTTRGCPHACAFCCNWALRKLYKNKGNFIRKRSIELVIRELEEIQKRYNFASMCIHDENFFVRPEEEIEEFAREYKKRINLPFQVEFSPQMFDERKMKHLLEAGLYIVQMGIQSACSETNAEIYKRFSSPERISSLIKFFQPYQDNIIIKLHFLLFNPWEDNKSLIETIRFAFSLPAHFKIAMYPLVFYPGTEIYERARREGYINDSIKDIVLKGFGLDRLKEANYLTLCFYILASLRSKGGGKSSKKLMEFLVRPKMVDFFDKKFLITPISYLFYYFKSIRRVTVKA